MEDDEPKTPEPKKADDSKSPQPLSFHQSKSTPKRRTPKTIGSMPVWGKAFFAALRRSGNILIACKAARIDRSLPFVWRKKSPKFLKAFKQAMAEATDRLENEAVRRAYKGVTRKKFTAKGEPVIDPKTGKHYIEREYSDSLLMFLLRAHRPAKFRERYDANVNTNVKGQMDLTHHGIDISKLTDEQIRQLEAIAATLLPQPAGDGAVGEPRRPGGTAGEGEVPS